MMMVSRAGWLMVGGAVAVVAAGYAAWAWLLYRAATTSGYGETRMRLETEEGRFVADVRPDGLGPIAALPDEVVFWGTRVFVRRHIGGHLVWRETLPLVVTEIQV